MNKIILILISLAISLFACDNQDKEFDDFGTTSVYFPFQTPARTLILGNYDLGNNDNDNNHRFEIGVTMAGVYTNKEERKVHYQLAPELLDEVDNVVALPGEYYTIETQSPVTIPVGSIKGRIQVQLTEEFFNDPLSFAPLNEVHFVIPLLITEAERLDTILSGKPVINNNPLRVDTEEWEITPKDYTLFGIKFMNKYHAKYLRRGVDEMTNVLGETVSNVYHEEFVVEDELVMLTTTGKKSVDLTNIVRRGAQSSPGKVNFELVFTDDENCTVESVETDLYNVSGSGKFVENGDTWGGEKRDVIYLDYSYVDAVNNESHIVKDTLVVRDRNVVFEEFTIVMTE